MPSRFQKFLSYYRPYLGLFIADVFASMMVAAVTLTLPLCARYISKDILENNSPTQLQEIFLVAAGMLVLLGIYVLCNYFYDFRGHYMGAMMESDMREELFAHYQKLSFRFYDEEKTAQLMTRLTNDIFWLSELYHHGPEDLIIALVSFTGTLIILFMINPILSLIILAFLPVMGLYAYYFNKRMNRTLAISHQRIGDINAQIEDSLSGVRVVQSFSNESLENAKFSEANRRFLRSRRDVYRSEAYFDTGMKAFTHLLTIAVIVFGAITILSDGLGLADLVTYLLYVAIMVEPVQRLINFSRLYQEGITGFNRFMEVLEVQPEIQEVPNPIEIKEVQGCISFKNVSFRYREKQAYVLNNLSLEIAAGEYIAVVGTSGVGKTTFASLIPRFYDVQEGEILLDGINIKELSLASLRKNIGVMQQDVYLFAGTVAENIRYGKLDATMDEIIEAAKKANAHDFIMNLPDGYETDIGQRGVKLSGGQKQRLSIARVFLKDPAVLIFDEATSSLDNESEKAIQSALETLSEKRTSIVIAHRLSTIRNAQRILVLGDEGILEQGTHEELMADNGTYASLYNVQLSI